MLEEGACPLSYDSGDWLKKNSAEFQLAEGYLGDYALVAQQSWR